MKSSFLKKTKKPGDVEVRDTIALLEDIKSGVYKDQVSRVQNEQDDDKRTDLKMALSGVVWTGRFSYRKKEGLLEHNGLAILDFDKIYNAEEYRDSLKNDEWIYAAWVSPSGKGVKALAKIPKVHSDEEYKEYYEALLDYYNDAEADAKTKDISRLAFNSYDPDLWINNKAIEWTERKASDTGNETLPETEYYYSEYEIFQKLEKWMGNKGESYFKGNRNNYIFSFASACNRFGIVRDSVYGYISSNYDLPEKEIHATVNSAYRNSALFGTARFENKAEFGKIVDRVYNGESKKNVLKAIVDNGIDAREADKVYDKAVAAVNDKLETFWTTARENKKVKLYNELMKYINWLTDAGFYKYYYSGNEYMLVKVDRNIIKEVTPDIIKSYVKRYILSLPMKFDMIERTRLYDFVFQFREKDFFGRAALELLSNLPIKFVKDTKDKSFLFYKNTALEVTKDAIIPIKYEELDGYIWENQIVDREFVEDKTTWKSFEFFKFMQNITGNKQNLKSLMTIAGYMLHGYKNPAKSVAPILNDCILSEGINGGTGKGLFVKALGKVKPMVTFDAKNWDINKQFAFQRVDLDSKIIFIDDVQRRFDFEKLFSVITEGITVEKKNKPEFFISFADAPKIIIATNYAISGEGNSHNRRRIEIEFVKHYHANYTPFDEFGRYFFSDWDRDDWITFDNLMIQCLRMYLKTGLESAVLENLAKKKLISETNELFVEWVTDPANFNVGVHYNLRDLYDDYIEYSGYKKTTVGYFAKTLKRYANFIEEKYHSERISSQGVKITMVRIGNSTGEGVSNEQDDQLPF